MARVVYRVGDDISTDVIYPGRYMATVLPTETPQFVFADDAAFNGRLKAKQIPPGSVTVKLLFEALPSPQDHRR